MAEEINQLPETPIAPSPAPVSEIKPSSNSKKPLMTILGILVGFLVIGGAVFAGMKLQQTKQPQVATPTAIPTKSILPTAVPTTDPTVGWKTFINNKFTFKYPTNITVEDSIVNKTVYVGLTTEINKFKNEGGGSGNPNFMTITYDQPLTNFYEVPSGSKILEKKDIVIDNKQATEYLLEVTGNTVGFSIGDKITRITIKDVTSWQEFQLTDQNQIQLFDQILSTFKFN